MEGEAKYSVETLASDRLTTACRVSDGNTHMDVASDLLGNQSVKFSHDTRELRDVIEPGWQRNAAKEMLNDPKVKEALKDCGFDSKDVWKQVDKQHPPLRSNAPSQGQAKRPNFYTPR